MLKLTRSEIDHFKNDANCKTLNDFKENRISQKRLDPNHEVCWDCRIIAKKLGIE